MTKEHVMTSASPMPLRQVDETEEPASPAPTRQMLVIDDDGTHRMVISLLARQLGYATTEASTVVEAAALIATRRFDCMTLDLRMGAQYGAELLEVMHEVQSDTPVIVISSVDEAERWEVLRLATLYGIPVTEMPKPLDLERLQDVFMEISDIA
jgi:two-component system chemotaxis response regulator CheY